MKLKVYLLLIISTVTLRAFSQDKIYKKNGEVIEVKVTEIGESEIKYKIFKEPNGPSYSIDKDRLTKIIYESGREESFKTSLKDAELYADQMKSAIKLNFLAPLLGYTQISYEKNQRPGRSYELSLGIIGLGKRQKYDSYTYSYNYSSTNQTFYRGAAGAFIGAGYKFIRLPNFVRSGDKYSHIMQGLYVKPEVILGVFSQNQYQSTSKKETVSMGALIINLGKQWILGDAFLLDIYGGLGYAVDSQNNKDFFNSYNGNDFGLLVAGDSGIGFTSGVKIGFLLGDKKKK